MSLYEKLSKDIISEELILTENEKRKIGMIPMKEWSLSDIEKSFDDTGNICFDGMSCVGKTTIMNENCKVFKVNSILDTTDYNHNATTAFCYMELQMIYYGKNTNVIIDRSPLSNIAFQYVYWLMDNFDQKVNMSPFMWCDVYTRMHRMQNLLEYVKAKKINIVFIVNSNLNDWQYYMQQRGGRGDKYKSNVELYGKCQLYAYIYLAHVLNLPIIDHANDNFSTNISNMRELIKSNYISDDKTHVMKHCNNFNYNEKLQYKEKSRCYNKR